MLAQSIRKNSALLSAFAAITAGLIALTYQATAGRIADAERRAAQQALFELVPPTRHNNDLLSDTLLVPAADAAALLMDPPLIHVARQDGEPVAWIVPTTAPDGYSGAIKLLVGVNVDGTIAGVRVLRHAETPGLGDKIELAKSAWILAFDGKSLAQPATDKWAVKKDGGDFDQFAGATITPRAVVQQIKRVLQYVQNHREDLLEMTRSNPPIAP